MSNTVTATVTLINKRGLHARASNKFMECVMRFNAEVLVRSHNDVCAETVVADSVMELLLLGAACGEDITVSATGEDAQPAVSALVELVEDRFGESE
ncbi:HPr family phosphocarrier protein [Hellea sp.]|nr:HPr family phosphocarrier protein [Hellea sp.]